MKFVSLDHNFDNGSPARVHRPTGTVYLTPRFYEMYTPIQQRFIILHELGHYVQQTADETEADIFAADILTNLEGYKATFRALNQSLHDGGESDERRINLFNYLKNKDMNAIDDGAIITESREYAGVNYESFYDDNGCVYTNDYIGTGDIEEIEIADYLNYCDYNGLEYSDMSKKEFRAAKKQAKIDKLKAKNDVRQSRADARRTRADAKKVKAEAKKSLADKGISPMAGIGDALKSGIGAIGGLFGRGGGGGGADAASDPAMYADTGASKSKMPLIIGGVAAAVVVAIIIVVVLRKKKK